jgi:phage I-like protein
MKDASGHEHDEKGLFTGPGGSGVTPASELKKKSTGELTKINPWDDEKTKKMKMKLAKMHAGNQALKDDIAKRKAHIEQMKKDNAKMKKELGINADVCFGGAVALNWKAPEDGSTQVKVQLSPFGEFMLHDGGKRNGTVQHCSKAAFEALVANWKAAGSPDVLVDVDHASARGGSTEAAAWCNSLEVDDNGLQGVFNLTPKGLELVKNRSYRFVSPGWTLSPDGTPVSLCSVALTNRPNLPVKPVVNADETGGRDPDDPNSRKDNPEMDIKKLAAALGLPETATEEEVLAAIKAMQDREAQAAAEAANAKAEEFADNAVKAGKIAANSKEAVKAAYLKSPEVAQEMLNSVAAPAPAAKLPDFTAAKQPTALNARTPGKDADPVEVYNAYMAMPEGADKDAYLAANAQAISDGYEKAQKK